MSNLFKSASVIPVEAYKQVLYNRQAQRPAPEEEQVAEAAPEQPPGPDEETLRLKTRIIADAEQYARQLLSDSAAEAEQLLAEARKQIDQWWEERRTSDNQLQEEMRQSAFAEGYGAGFEAGNEESARVWEQQLADASQLLTSAYELREQIIQEAEPFLVELSCAIAGKIIDRELDASGALILELVRKALGRRREQGIITLCVAPAQLQFVQAAREELTLAVDSQAELRIVPDATVKDAGCVIRSSFGSIDARIDTQLQEIKRELVQLVYTDAESLKEETHGGA